ncbi:adenine phosphoribosyltransferase [Terrilactibacillus laevilacticus]|uniref:Adenine phosphoribosyltransferase n=1 Tax=Terrilactibacillus laevilacticus TaxID=1380157 RepID=A0ABW5PTU6_9BACI|nr:adenine phosphoribosyltransferase [Terrilactibacillus laevilacticus]
MNYRDYIAIVKDFPKEGIIFKDITPLLQDGPAYQSAIEEFATYANRLHADVIVGPEARGFVVGCPIATSLKIGFVPVRKKGKLPRETVEATYGKEYGEDVLCLHRDAIKPGQKVVIADDLLATGGTISATIELVEKLGGIVVGLCFLIELTDLNGREKLQNYDIFTLMEN